MMQSVDPATASTHDAPRPPPSPMMPEVGPAPVVVPTTVEWMRLSAFRTLSLAYNLARGRLDYDKMNAIAPGLFLGMLPVKSTLLGAGFAHTHDQIAAFVRATDPSRPLRLVVSVVEPDELRGTGFAGVTLVSPADWRATRTTTTSATEGDATEPTIAIEHCLVEMRDFQADVDHNQALAALRWMRRCIADDHGSVYVHCKAGRSRSPMLCEVYLAAYGLPDPPRQGQPESAPDPPRQAQQREAVSDTERLRLAAQWLRDRRRQVDVDVNKERTALALLRQLEACPPPPEQVGPVRQPVTVPCLAALSETDNGDAQTGVLVNSAGC